MTQVTGVITEIQQEEKITDKFTKRRFVIEEGDKHINTIVFSLLNDRTDLIDPYSAGEKVKVSYNIRSKKHDEKWYTELNAWRIERV